MLTERLMVVIALATAGAPGCTFGLAPPYELSTNSSVCHDSDATNENELQQHILVRVYREILTKWHAVVIVVVICCCVFCSIY